MNDIYLPPANKIPDAILDLPGSKSIANRVLLIASMANGVSIIHNVPLISEDVLLMLDALSKLGIKLSVIAKDSLSSTASYRIEGCGGAFANAKADIFCGNSGTSIRFLASALALQKSSQYELSGVARMHERPIRDLVDSLATLGANISYTVNKGYPPLMIRGFTDSGTAEVKISGKTSSQYLTALLIALPLLKRRIAIEVIDGLISAPYVNITLKLLEKFGCSITNEGNKYIISGVDELQAIEYTIEPDASSASYFLALGALRGRVQVNHLSANSLQGDKDFGLVLAQMGAKVNYFADAIEVKADGSLKALNIDMENMPDVAMTLAVMALFVANKTTLISGISSWKVKETDRLAAMHNELTKLGAKVSITDESISITAPAKINENIAIDTYNDHRIAMCFSLLAAYGVAITIKDYQCVGKTFANYFDLFKALCY